MVASMKAAFDKVGTYTAEQRAWAKLVTYVQQAKSRDLRDLARNSRSEFRKDDSLMDGILIACFRAVLADMDGVSVNAADGKGQSPSEPKTAHAPTSAAVASGKGQVLDESNMTNARPFRLPDGTGKAGATAGLKPTQHMPPPARPTPKGPTAGQKAAELAVARQSAFDFYKIGTRPIGNLSIASLRAEMETAAMGAATGLRHGLHQTLNLLLMRKIDNHCVVVNPNELVRNVITEKVLTQLYKEAETEAPKLIEKGMKMYADNLPRLIEGGINGNV